MKKTTEPVRVMIVEDHAVVREGLRNFLRLVSEFYVAAEAASGDEALAAIEKAKPQVVLMDLVMPGLDGVETTRRIHKEHP